MDNENITDSVIIPTEKKVKVVEVKYDINELAQHLCCPNQFHNIIDILPTLTQNEIKTLRGQLRSRTGMNHMPYKLEYKFRVSLGEE